MLISTYAVECWSTKSQGQKFGIVEQSWPYFDGQNFDHSHGSRHGAYENDSLPYSPENLRGIACET